VESYDVFERPLSGGHSYFQVYFFNRPEMLTRHDIPSNDLFLLGLLLPIDAILDMPMGDVLRETAVSEEIRGALLGEKNRLRELFDLAMKYEMGCGDLIEGLTLTQPPIEGSVRIPTLPMTGFSPNPPTAAGIALHGIRRRFPSAASNRC
jgi:c-di-GMP-related signal transduction protein